MTKLKGSDRTSNDLPGPSGKRSGRVAFDERGNSVWEWQLETGVYSRDVSTQRLKKLELDELSIAETAANKRPTGLAGGESKAPSTGFNPYDNTTRGRWREPLRHGARARREGTGRCAATKAPHVG